MLHGLEQYIIRGEGLIAGSLFPDDVKRSVRGGKRKLTDPVATPERQALAPKRTFCRLFARGAAPDAQALIDLGMAMEKEKAGADPSGDSAIDAGLTYFGQFLDHDITFDPTPLSTGDPTGTPTDSNQRTPALDLDSLYGGGPSVRPELYQSDGASLKVGYTVRSDDRVLGEVGSKPNDLCRGEDRVAVIADPRNDENLAIAQLHLAFIKFHNSFVEEIKADYPRLPTHRLFATARERTIEHYQRIVLKEFLPRVIDSNAVELVLGEGTKIFTKDMHDCMPLEFSVAAYRMGHSMIRPSYEWNAAFNSQPGALAPATLELLFEFTNASGRSAPGDDPFRGEAGLPSNWIVDWRLMFEIPGHPAPQPFKTNKARKLDTSLAFALQDLPEFAQEGDLQPEFLSLATRNLLRGRLVDLASGQDVAKGLADAGVKVAHLSEDTLRGGPHGALLDSLGLVQNTPLWYYIMREAEDRGGDRLGPIGSRLVAETLVGLIRNSDVSVLRRRSVDTLAEIPDYTMADLLLRVGELNPLGDAD